MWAILALLGFLVAFVGFVAVLVPLRRLGIPSRSAGVKVMLAGVVVMVGAAMMLPQPAQVERNAPASSATTDPLAEPVAQSTAAPAPPPIATPAPAPPATWTAIASWRGTGMKQTEGFHTTAREWRIRWAATNEVMKGAGLLQIYVHDGSDRMVSLAANALGERADVSYVRTPPGEHYLQISSANIDYTITVEERR